MFLNLHLQQPIPKLTRTKLFPNLTSPLSPLNNPQQSHPVDNQIAKHIELWHSRWYLMQLWGTVLGYSAIFLSICGNQCRLKILQVNLLLLFLERLTITSGNSKSTLIKNMQVYRMLCRFSESIEICENVREAVNSAD